MGLPDCLHLDAEPAYFDLPNTNNQWQAFVSLTKHLVRAVFTDDRISHLQTDGYANMKRSLAEFPFPYTYEASLQHLNKLCKMPPRLLRWVAKNGTGIVAHCARLMLAESRTSEMFSEDSLAF